MAIQRLMTWLCFALCFSQICLSLQQKADLRVELEPHFIQITRETPVTLTCTLTDGDGGRVPLAGCGFRDHNSGAAWDIETGSATINNTINFREVTGILTNPGDDDGICRLKIAGLTSGNLLYLLGCRVRPASGGAWRYEAMMVYATGDAHQKYRLQPPGVSVSLPGSDVTIIGEAEQLVDACLFSLPPDKTYRPIDWQSWVNSTNTTRYRGWKEGRRCGITLLSVQPEHSGFVRGEVWSYSQPHRVSADFIELIVATPPVSSPRLSVNTTNASFQPGDMLFATCFVESSPVSNITWLLDGEIVRKDNWNEAPVASTWRWNYEPQKLMQRLSRRLTQQDDGKKLVCRAGHLALPSGTLDSNTHIIRFGDPCSSNPCGEGNVCSVVGSVVACSCQTSYVGRWPFCNPECNISSDCPAEKACVNQNCRKLCPGDCGQNALCRVTNHISSCECPDGFSGNPKTRCEEEQCGMPKSNPALVSGGYEARPGEFPWHAAIFKVLNDGTHRALCGGTLITTNVVITAAHCFYVVSTSKLMPRSLVKVVLGKLHLGWDVDLNDTNVQRFDVADLLAPVDFRGNSHNYIHDIAVVKLVTNAILTSEVKVACIDWGLRRNTFNRDQLKTGDIGKVAGWGISYNTTERSPVLQWIDLPWVDMDTCRLNTHLGSRLYLTRGKFCAGYRNQQRSVCPGDSGGGLVFLNATNHRYYLKGVVSTSLAYNTHILTCHADHYTAFTSVADYFEWIMEQL